MNCWAGILGTHIIGPTFIEGGPLNGERYLELLQDTLPNLLADAQVPADLVERHYFMQDGAPPHFTLPVRAHLSQVRSLTSARCALWIQ